MNCYGPLADWYDSLTGDIPYEQFADYYEAEFHRNGGEFRLLLDLCCGTGTLTGIMAERGYEMIAADASVDMLMQAQSKEVKGTHPLYLCQSAENLDLYGTVDACYSSLDGFNYIQRETLSEVFRRLMLFIRPGGLLIFDIHPGDWFRSLDGQIFVDEEENVLCLWRADFDEQINAIRYDMDLFSKRGALWDRKSEEHIEYVHEPEDLMAIMKNAGFENIEFRTDGPQGRNGRLFVTAVRP